jgi:hypothetical protein
MLKHMTHSDKKFERQKRAMMANKNARTVQLVSLSNALMRARSVRDAFQMLTHASKEPSHLSDELLAALQNHVHSEVSRSHHLVGIYLALINCVVEKWRKWEFTDVDVDDRLSNRQQVKDLKAFRDAVFHASEFNDNAFRIEPSLIEWTYTLDEALGGAMRKQLNTYWLISSVSNNDVTPIVDPALVLVNG